MAGYRKFWLVNSKDETWELTNVNFKSFLQNPSNLGYSKAITTTRYSERLNKLAEEYDFPMPTGDVLFYDDHNSSKYEKYYEFTRFLSHTPLTLYYQLPVSSASQIPDTYKLIGDVMSITKTEVKEDGLLRCTIQFMSFTFFIGEEITFTGSDNQYTLVNGGDFPVGFEIEIKGSMTNPFFTVTKDNDMYGEAKFEDTTAFSSVYVNSKDSEQNVKLKQGDAFLPNPLSYQDLSISNGAIYVTFLKLERGTTILDIGYESGSITSVDIKYIPQYRSV